MTSLFAVNVAAQAVSGGNVLTLLQLQASGQKGLRVVRWGVSFDGTDVTDVPVRVELARQTTGSSSQASAYTPVKWREESIDQVLATALTSFTAEPGGGAVLETRYISPVGVPLDVPYLIDSLDTPSVAPGSRIGIRVLSDNAVNASAYIVFAE